MSSGLQRRRVNKSEDTPDYPEDGKKVAYDPEEERIHSNSLVNPNLTLMEEVVLMGLKDKEGYLSFWNDNISYALRGLIVIELALRGKIQVVDDSARKRFDVSDRLIQVIDSSKTGEVLLDEALNLMKNDEPLPISQWIDLLSGETWNLLKINYQLKQVRERLAKGLVDKGVLRTERKNFLVFDMATHPVADSQCKEAIKRRILSLLVSRTSELNYNSYFSETAKWKWIRSVCLVGGAYAANVLENVVSTLAYEQRDKAFSRADELVVNFSEYPFKQGTETGISVNLDKEVLAELDGEKADLQMEVVAGVLQIFSRMDSLL